MKICWLLCLCVFFTTAINAEYARSIRIGSFPSQEDAQISLQKINLFVSKHENIIRLQKQHGFIFKTRASGDFYITLVEPFKDRTVLQEVLDTLRLEYKDIYVTKLKNRPKEKQEKKPEVVKEVEIIEKNIVEEVYPQKSLDVQIESIEKEIKSTTTPIVIPSNRYIYQIILVILLFGIALLIYYLLRIKKEKERYINKELIQEEHLEQLKVENHAKDKLLSHVSHELRTPMTAIMGLTHLVLESDLTKIQTDYIQKIESSSQHLLNLINDILDVSKIKAGELKIEKKEFNIDDILEYVLSVNVTKAKKMV